MTILVTNDDGIYSAGLQALVDAFSDQHDVWVLAPDGERSGSSNRITIAEPIRCSEVGPQRYASSGTPADCVILAALGAIPVRPQLVVSGVNIGPNLGSDIIYSGTCAAARQAVYKHIPGIAVSINCFREPFHFGPVTAFLRDNVDTLLDVWDDAHFININAPNLSEVRGVEVARPAMRRYDDHLLPFQPPRGGTYYFVDGTPIDSGSQPGTDWDAVQRGMIALSPIALNPINHDSESAYAGAGFVRGNE